MRNRNFCSKTAETIKHQKNSADCIPHSNRVLDEYDGVVDDARLFRNSTHSFFY